MTPMYQSSALLYINNSSFSVGGSSISLADLNTSKSLVDTYVVIMKARTTLNEVIRRTKLSYSYDQLKNMLSANAVNSTQIMQITVTSKNPEEATIIANTMAEVLPERVYEITDGSAVRIVDYAVVPASKSSPNVTKYTAVGLLAGAVLSAGIIILLDLLDDQIRDSDFLIRTYGLSMLAVVPDLKDSKTGKGYYYYYKEPSKHGKRKKEKTDQKVQESA